MRLNLIVIAGLLALSLMVVGCASGKKVTRVSTDKITDLSGRWNDTDSQQVARAIVQEALDGPWLGEWRQDHDGRPTVIVGAVINKSHEHINVETFKKDIQKALINSGKVRFVSSRQERKEVRDERLDQHEGWTSEETRAGVGQEIGANFIMKGQINTIPDEEGGMRVMFYQVNFELHNLTTNEIAWIGDHKIKKVIER